MKTFSGYTTDIPRIINNSQADNITWATELIMDSIRYLVTKYYFNERTYTTATVASQQFYNLPPQVKKLINLTISIGSVLWQPKECPTRQFWDALNVINFTQDFPSYFFIYNGQVGIYPIPSSSSNIMTMNYKTRITDLSMADVTDTTSSRTIAITTNTATLTASGALFLKWMEGQWIRLSHSATDANNGDNQWYQINSVTSTTVAVLKNAYTGATVTASGFTIGEVPILPEDYQDLPLYRLGVIYYTTRFPDAARAGQYQKLWDIGEAKLNEEFGSKTSSIILNDTDEAMIQPNLFQRSLTQV
jgi:hypothetical protein